MNNLQAFLTILRQQNGEAILQNEFQKSYYLIDDFRKLFSKISEQFNYSQEGSKLLEIDSEKILSNAKFLLSAYWSLLREMKISIGRIKMPLIGQLIQELITSFAKSWAVVLHMLLLRTKEVEFLKKNVSRDLRQDQPQRVDKKEYVERLHFEDNRDQEELKYMAELEQTLKNKDRLLLLKQQITSQKIKEIYKNMNRTKGLFQQILESSSNNVASANQFMGEYKILQKNYLQFQQKLVQQFYDQIKRVCFRQKKRKDEAIQCTIDQVFRQAKQKISRTNRPNDNIDMEKAALQRMNFQLRSELHLLNMRSKDESKNRHIRMLASRIELLEADNDVMQQKIIMLYNKLAEYVPQVQTEMLQWKNQKNLVAQKQAKQAKQIISEIEQSKQLKRPNHQTRGKKQKQKQKHIVNIQNPNQETKIQTIVRTIAKEDKTQAEGRGKLQWSQHMLGSFKNIEQIERGSKDAVIRFQGSSKKESKKQMFYKQMNEQENSPLQKIKMHLATGKRLTVKEQIDRQTKAKRMSFVLTHQHQLTVMHQRQKEHCQAGQQQPSARHIVEQIAISGLKQQGRPKRLNRIEQKQQSKPQPVVVRPGVQQTKLTNSAVETKHMKLRASSIVLHEKPKKVVPNLVIEIPSTNKIIFKPRNNSAELQLKQLKMKEDRLPFGVRHSVSRRGGQSLQTYTVKQDMALDTPTRQYSTQTEDTLIKNWILYLVDRTKGDDQKKLLAYLKQLQTEEKMQVKPSKLSLVSSLRQGNVPCSNLEMLRSITVRGFLPATLQRPIIENSGDIRRRNLSYTEEEEQLQESLEVQNRQRQKEEHQRYFSDIRKKPKLFPQLESKWLSHRRSSYFKGYCFSMHTVVKD